MKRVALLVAAFALACAGCGGGSDEGAEPAEGGTTTAAGGAEGELSVAQAKENGGTGLMVRAFVFVRDDEWLLCNTFDETSYPPVCLEPTLTIANPDAVAAVKLAEGVGQAGGLRWSERPVSLTGDVQGDAVTVSEVTKP
jgi:hypothetical protein